MPTLSIRFTSDWRVGTGGGDPGGVDERARRDGSGLPVVPAKTLTGIWRDGCERVARALDSGDAGPWHDWVETLFGSQPGIVADRRPPRQASLTVRTATLPHGIASAVSMDAAVTAALFGVRPGVKLDPDNHQPVDKHLRFAETVRSGVVLTADLAVADSAWSAEQRTTAWTFLALGAQECRTLGAGRRRGLGRCVIELADIDEGARRALDATAPPTPAPVPVRSAELSVGATEVGREWQTITVRALCVDPVLSPSVSAGFEVRGLPYLPGARLFPAVAAAAGAAGIDLGALIAADALICGPLVPELAGVAAKPLPKCLVAAKTFDGEGALVNRFNLPVENLRTPAGAWLVDCEQGAILLHPDTEIRLHNTVQDDMQRPTEEVGGLFSYQVIPAGSWLSGAVHVRISDEQAQRIAARLAGGTALGSSRKDEYGRVTLDCAVAPRTPPEGIDSEEAVFYFRTDTVLLDDSLAPVTSLTGVIDVLANALRIETLETDDRHAITFRRIDSWQSRWTRPRQTLIAIAAGSVLTVRRRDGEPFDGKLLAQLEFEGLGERRAEGFGQLEVNPTPLRGDGIEVGGGGVTAPQPTDRDAAVGDGDDELLTELQAVAFSREVERAIAATSANVSAVFEDLPASQRGHVRQVLRTAAASPDPTAVVSEFRASLTAAKVRSSRWTTQAVHTLAQLTERGAIWKVLDIDVAGGWRAAAAPTFESWAVSRFFSHLGAGGARRIAPEPARQEA